MRHVCSYIYIYIVYIPSTSRLRNILCGLLWWRLFAKCSGNVKRAQCHDSTAKFCIHKCIMRIHTFSQYTDISCFFFLLYFVFLANNILVSACVCVSVFMDVSICYLCVGFVWMCSVRICVCVCVCVCVFEGLLTLSGVCLYISYSQQAWQETERRMGEEQMARVYTSFGWSLGMAWLSFILEVLTGLLLFLASRMVGPH